MEICTDRMSLFLEMNVIRVPCMLLQTSVSGRKGQDVETAGILLNCAITVCLLYNISTIEVGKMVPESTGYGKWRGRLVSLSRSFSMLCIGPIGFFAYSATSKIM